MQFENENTLAEKFDNNQLASAMRKFLSIPDANRKIENCSTEFFWDEELNVAVSRPVTKIRYSDETFISSLRSALATYPIYNNQLDRSSLSGKAVGLLCFLASILLRLIGADRVYIIDNTPLTSNNLALHGTLEFERSISSALRKFGKNVAVRGLNKYQHEKEIEILRSFRFILVPFRPIFILSDPGRALRNNKSIKHDVRKSRRMNDLEFCKDDVLTDAEFEHCTQMFRGIYLGKYSSQNPQYTKDFFASAAKSGLLKFATFRIKVNREIVGFITYSDTSDCCGGPAVGYDQKASKAYPLYRALMLEVVRHSASEGKILHWSSGVGHFKRTRGAQEYMEFIAIHPGNAVSRIIYTIYANILSRIFASPGFRKALGI